MSYQKNDVLTVKIEDIGGKLPFIRSISRDNINFYRTRTSLG